jgi:Phytanoyl-CoA dioxygenase (PhyH)
MRVPDDRLAELRERGHLLFEGFLDADEMAAAQVALWLHYPRPEEYFTESAAHAWLATSPWAGLIKGPWRSWALSRLAFHPDLVDLAERFLGSADLRLYDAEMWAKYAGAADYEQRHHRDLSNHSLVAPKRSDPARQLQCWILLRDVGEDDGPTKVVPLSVGESIPYWPRSFDGSANDYVTHYLPAGAFADEEISVTGPAGTLFCFRTDVWHRASRLTGERSARFVLLAHYDVWGPRWTGTTSWAERAREPGWVELIERATPRERSLFGFPPPGDPYWDDQTFADTQARYPRADLTPYR